MNKFGTKAIACLMSAVMVTGCGSAAATADSAASSAAASSETAAASAAETSSAAASSAASDAASSETAAAAATDDLSSYSSDEKVTLVIEATQDGAAHGRVYNQKIIDGFEAKYPNIKIEMNIVPDNQMGTLVQTQLTTGEVPDLLGSNWESSDGLQYDINFYALDNEPWVPRLADADGLKLPVNGKLDHMYMLCPEIGIEGQGIVYNKDIFEKAGITKLPTNYQELLDACEKVKAIGVTPFFIPGKDAWTTQVWATAAVGDLAENVDKTLISDINTGKRKWSDSKEYIQILDEYNSLVTKGYTNKDVLADDYNKAQEEFINGQYAMIAMGDFFFTAIDQQKHVNAGIFPIPWRDNASISHSMGGGLFIPAKAKNLKEARLFLNYLSQPEQLQIMQDVEPYVPRFKDGPEGKLADYQEQEYEYMQSNGKCTQLNDLLVVDPSESWKLYQDMLGGDKTPEEVASEWSDTFAQLMQDKGVEGF
jgi:raffinose/stachyose/melibiose transport system substrate-binding protein